MKYCTLITILCGLLLSACVEQKKEVSKDVENEAQASAIYTYDVEKRLEELGIELTTPPPPVANYVNAVTSGNLVFMAGKGPTTADGSLITGKVGADLSVDEGYEAAKRVAAAQLSALKAEIGDLNKVSRIVKVTGMVNCTPDFTSQPEVINGFSDVMVAVFGNRGKHARAAVGMSSLPRNIAVEIDMIVEVEE